MMTELTDEELRAWMNPIEPIFLYDHLMEDMLQGFYITRACELGLAIPIAKARVESPLFRFTGTDTVALCERSGYVNYYTEGEAYRVAPVVLHELDKLQGHDMTRLKVKVVIGALPYQMWTYMVTPFPSGRVSLVSHGNYKKYCEDERVGQRKS